MIQRHHVHVAVISGPASGPANPIVSLQRIAHCIKHLCRMDKPIVFEPLPAGDPFGGGKFPTFIYYWQTDHDGRRRELWSRMVNALRVNRADHKSVIQLNYTESGIYLQIAKS